MSVGGRSMARRARGKGTGKMKLRPDGLYDYMRKNTSYDNKKKIPRR